MRNRGKSGSPVFAWVRKNDARIRRKKLLENVDAVLGELDVCPGKWLSARTVSLIRVYGRLFIYARVAGGVGQLRGQEEKRRGEMLVKGGRGLPVHKWLC